MRFLRALAWVSLITGCALLLYTGFRIWDPFATQPQHALTGDLYLLSKVPHWPNWRADRAT